jgi:regulator of cell morphogenesis and NO signaling
MNLNENNIDENSFVTDIVAHDYRTADIFRKYDIDFCCGGKWPLDMACKAKGLDTAEVLKELKRTLRHTASSVVPEFDDWSIDFLADYILNIHHRYLHKALPDANEYVTRFLEGHRKKFPELGELEKIMQKMMKDIPPHMKKEEEVIFPYIKQIYHAYRHRESYASLLIRTLRKPVEEVMKGEHDAVGKQLHRIREITNNFTLPPKACITHRVTYAKLKELDNNLVQHIHLENNILFPKAIEMEKELLLIKD